MTERESRRSLAAGALAFLLLMAVVIVSNTQSTISDLAAAGIAESPRHVWIWEITSMLAWFSVIPVLWILAGRLVRDWPLWRMPALLIAIGLPLASAWHIALMIGLRHVVYALFGESYTFEGWIEAPYLYEFRKDFASYLQFLAVCLLGQWLSCRQAGGGNGRDEAEQARAKAVIELVDGSTRHLLPTDSIEHVAAAGNYVEIAAEGRSYLHRATLALVEAELAPEFVRIHRSRLVNRATIRRITTEKNGDFTVELSSGTVLRGSRRYRERLTEGDEPLSQSV